MRLILSLSSVLSLMVNQIFCMNQEIPIIGSNAKSWYKDNVAPVKFKPGNAHDNDPDTFYSVKDGDTQGNFISLHLAHINAIYEVKITNRLDTCCSNRIRNTALYVYFKDDLGNEREVKFCGKITGTVRNSEYRFRKL